MLFVYFILARAVNKINKTMAESVKLDFNAIRNISGKTLKQFTVHRVVDICTKALEKAEAAPEIFNFLFTEYIRIMDHGDLDGKLFKFVLPQVLQSIKQNLETNKLDTLLAFLETLTKLTQFMATEVILNNLQILKFEEFIHNSLAILKQLFLAAYSTEQSDLMESTLTYYTAFLDILKSEHVIFFSEDEFSSDGSDKFSKSM